MIALNHNKVQPGSNPHEVERFLADLAVDGMAPTR